MSNAASSVDVKAAEDHLMKFLSVDGVTGEEAAIAAAVSDELKKVGVPASAIRFDDANKRIPLPTQTGNLIVDIPGTRPGPRLLFSTHLDAVPLCAGAKPKRDGDRIVSDGKTALGGDNRTGCAVLVALAETLLKHKLPHPPITLLFTVREESGLHGARELDPDSELEGAIAGDNATFAGLPRDNVTLAVHICRGNSKSRWFTEGGYDAIAEKLFGSLDVDTFLLEYDTERSGGFEPLRLVPRGKTVVLGLITSKSGKLEDKGAIERRIEEASKYAPLDQLCLSPQCGFASTEDGNTLSIEEQWAKLARVVEIAKEVWG